MSATPEHLAVHAWPSGQPLALAELHVERGFTVISVPTPDSNDRVAARDLIRTALRQTVAEFLGLPVATVVLHSCPGQRIRVEVAQTFSADWSLSVSHAPGLSVAALGRGVGVGVDVVQMDPSDTEMPDWECVARDYLGPATAEGLRCMSTAHRAAAFAEAWTQWEARLKCLGQPLTEWTPALAQQLATCRTGALALPGNYLGALAVT